MIDLDEFSSADFDVKTWVNRACADIPQDEPVEKFLAELEMKLQLSAEELESSLQEYSTQAMKRIPYAVQEVFRLQGDIQGMQDQVKSTLEQVSTDGDEAVSATSYIAELDRVKSNAESACSTLKEATELSDLFYKIEDAFAAGDLPAIADMLTTMRRSLNLVGDVPEFRAGKQKLGQLEDRLQSLVEGSFADALQSNAPDSIHKLAKILIAVDRYSVIESLYCSSRLTSINIIFESTCQSQPDITKGLPAFYTDFLTILNKESTWCSTHLPDLRSQLLSSLVLQAFTRISPPTRNRIASLSSFPLLTTLQQQAVAFCNQMQGTLSSTPPDEISKIFRLVFSPLEDQVSHYAAIEARHLEGKLSSVIPPPLTSDEAESELEASIAPLSTSVNPAFEALTACVDRCMSLTGGTQLPDLLPVIDNKLTAYLTRLSTLIQAIFNTHILPLTPDALPSSPSSSSPAPSTLHDHEVAVIVTLVTLAHTLSTHLQSLETLIHTSATTATSSLTSASERGPSPPIDLLSLRLNCAPNKLSHLSQLATSLSSDPPTPPLPSSSSQLEATQQLAHDTVLAALLAPVRQALHTFPSLPEWTKQPDPTGILPSFNAFPLPYVTVTGEYLMTLPQHLEVLVDEDGPEGDGGSDTLAAEWLDLVVTAAAHALTDRMLRLPHLTQPGAAQMAADAEYFCNVMSALQVSVPSSLLGILLLVALPEPQFVETAKGTLAEGALEERVVRVLAGMRGYKFEAEAGSSSNGGAGPSSNRVANGTT